MAMLERSFFQRDPLTCARELIGCELIWNNGAGIIVETEAYYALGDEACHTFMRTQARTFVEKHVAGTAYVYLNYGMYWLLNVLVKGGAHDGFVLIRAIEPTRGVEAMQQRRGFLIPRPITQLCSGPGKLSIALGIDGRDHTRDLCSGEGVGFAEPPQPIEVIADVRIGISRAADLPWRFLAAGTRFASAPPSSQRKKKGQTTVKAIWPESRTG